MNWMNNLRIKTRLLGSFGVVRLMMGATGHLNDQAQGLKVAINRFHIGGRSQPAFFSPSPA